ncbi:hypothetical protein [Helicobacter bizzozeronii]|uniref:Uncharacterized protein n=1 Tax=Helicobacter bizzozeronii (strain CIII-1) TaxID=1002804 RepID=F8KUG1_HELBC|nr:hypothetical protein [Helicobacter bizzozeronii]CCB80896.1 hypothetical protein HBZC1_p0160 [Helicobacter bizzozeronii CIII-1]
MPLYTQTGDLFRVATTHTPKTPNLKAHRHYLTAKTRGRGLTITKTPLER